MRIGVPGLDELLNKEEEMGEWSRSPRVDILIAYGASFTVGDCN